jgi:hypothetical protein
MSLFTVIKYGNTKLSSPYEMDNLPEDVIREYYKQVHKKLNFITSGDVDEHFGRCAVLANIYNKWYALKKNPEGENEVKQIFKQVLLEYKE